MFAGLMRLLTKNSGDADRKVDGAGLPGAPRLSAVIGVSERQRAETKLLEQKNQIDVALNNMSQGVLLFDAEARLVICNRRYMEMYNL
jgi:PAS domain-containing protein